MIDPPQRRSSSDPARTDPFGRPIEAARVESHPEAASPGVRPPESATWALLLGIAGIVIVPLLASIAAWVIGARARRECRELPGRPGYGTASTGWVLGIVGTVGWLLFGAALILLFVVYVGDVEIVR